MTKKMKMKKKTLEKIEPCTVVLTFMRPKDIVSHDPDMSVSCAAARMLGR